MQRASQHGRGGQTCHHISAVAHPGRALGQRSRRSSNLCMQARSVPPRAAAPLSSPPRRCSRVCRPPAGDGAQGRQHGQQQAGQAGAHKPCQHLLACMTNIQRCQAARNLGAAPGLGHWHQIAGCTRRGQRTARAAFSALALSGACSRHSAWDCSARASAVRVPSSPLGAGSRAVLPRRSLAETQTCFNKLARASAAHDHWSAPVGEAVSRACKGLQQPGLRLPRRWQAPRGRSDLPQQVGQAAARPRQVPQQQRQLVGRVAALRLALWPRPARQCRPCMRRSQPGQPLANPQRRPRLACADAQQRAQHVSSCAEADLRAAALARQAADAQSATQRAPHAACGSGLWSSARCRGVPCCTPDPRAFKRYRSTRLTVPGGSKRLKGVRVAGAPNSARVVGSASRQVGEQLGHDREQLPGGACRTTLVRPSKRLTYASTAQRLGQHPAAARRLLGRHSGQPQLRPGQRFAPERSSEPVLRRPRCPPRTYCAAPAAGPGAARLPGRIGHRSAGARVRSAAAAGRPYGPQRLRSATASSRAPVPTP